MRTGRQVSFERYQHMLGLNVVPEEVLEQVGGDVYALDNPNQALLAMHPSAGLEIPLISDEIAKFERQYDRDLRRKQGEEHSQEN